MTLDEAFIQLIETTSFKEVAKQKNSLGGKYRIYLTRFRRGQLKSGAMVELLIAHGYEIKASRATKRN